MFVLSVAISQVPKSGILIPVFVVFSIRADCGTLSIDGSAAASFSPIVDKYEFIRLDFSCSVKARVPLSSLEGTNALMR